MTVSVMFLSNYSNLFTYNVFTCSQCTRELIRLIGPEPTYTELGDTMIPYAKRWAKFVLNSCERGRGTRPRWATAGLDFLTTACHPLMLMKLKDEEYEVSEVFLLPVSQTF